MQLQLKPTNTAPASIAGLLLPGGQPALWLGLLKGSGISLETCTAYAIPGLQANTICACLVVCKAPDPRQLPPAVTFVTLVAGRLFIPAYSSLYPAVSDAELLRLLPEYPCLLHPEVGLAPLESLLEWPALIRLVSERHIRTTTPADPIFIPSTIRRFEVAATTAEEQLQSLEMRLSPEKKKFEDQPLNALEKLKLALYRQLFSKAGSEVKEKGTVLRMLERLAKKLGQKLPALDRMQEDFESLEQRNASEVDKLLAMLKNNPEEALKYAFPLGDGTGRGAPGAIRLGQLRSNFSLFGNSNVQTGNGAGGVIPASHHDRLYQEYTRTAEALINQGAYEKAAFVYLKLLKNYVKAAQALEAGKLFADAAVIHLKYTGNKTNAAECYVKANMLTKAIELYEELGKHEQAGDLHMMLHHRDAAMRAYQKVVDSYTSGNQLLKAANLHRDKMDDLSGAQRLLLQGWRSSRDAYNCINVYFANITEPAARRDAIETIYRTETTPGNSGDFLTALRKETERSDELRAPIREIALEIIALRVADDPSVISQLRYFNKGNGLISKDILRFKTSRRS